MIISQLELGPPVNKQVSIGDTSFSFLYEFITVVKKEGFIFKHFRLQHKKNLINRSFSFYLGA